MLYNVAQLLKESVGASRKLTIDGELHDLDDLNPGPVPVCGELTLIRTEDGILATGVAEAVVTEECRRCLEPVQSAVKVEFEEEYVPSIDIETGAPLPTDETAPELVISERHILDLSEVMRQYLTMEATSTALCREDCKGICPQCGKNLNLGPCDCTVEDVDPRLEILKQLLDTDSQ